MPCFRGCAFTVPKDALQHMFFSPSRAHADASLIVPLIKQLLSVESGFFRIERDISIAEQGEALLESIIRTALPTQ